MINLKKIIPRNLRTRLMYSLKFLPDSLYIKLFYFSVSGQWLNLKNPKGFNEKQNWLKLHNRHPEYTDLVDKYAVRNHIDGVLDMDFSQLPNQFVLKCNHDSGSTKVIRDKNKLTDEDISDLKEHYMKCLKENAFFAGREYPYKGIKNRYILAETLMTDDALPDKSVEDYKFFCFDGVPKVMFVATDRYTDCRFDFFDMDFNHLDIENLHPHADKLIP